MLKQNLKVSQDHAKKMRSSTKQVLSRVAIGVSLFCTLETVQAQTIHKWIDANGKVHYGDESSASPKSQKVRVIDNKGSYSTESKLPQVAAKEKTDVNKKDEAEDKGKFGVSGAAIKSCIGFAKELAATPNGEGMQEIVNEGKRGQLAARISTTCPNIEISCQINVFTPEKDHCEALKSKGNDMVFSGTVNNVRREFTYSK